MAESEKVQIVEKYGIAEAPHSVGHVIVIDVLRAFTTAAFAFHQGAKRIILVSTPDEAFELKSRFKDALLVGENRGRIIPGFDYGNSPEQISRLNLAGRTVVLRSSSGTQGVVQATQAEQIYLGSLVVASPTVNLLRRKKVSPITILAMGSLNGPDKEEDLACQKYMSHLFSGAAIDREAIKNEVIQSPAGQMALDPNIDWKTPGDLECAVSIDLFDFAMPVAKDEGLLVAMAIRV